MLMQQTTVVLLGGGHSRWLKVTEYHKFGRLGFTLEKFARKPYILTEKKLIANFEQSE